MFVPFVSVAISAGKYIREKNDYLKALENEEHAAATIEKYRRALLSFATFLSGAAVTPEMIRLWKDDLRARKTTCRRRSTLIWQR